jgi:hypothetical protein
MIGETARSVVVPAFLVPPVHLALRDGPHRVVLFSLLLRAKASAVPRLIGIEILKMSTAIP